MASLIESLIDVLDKEHKEYTGLLDLSKLKTTAIVNGDVDNLQDILVKEQSFISRINKLDEQRMENVQDICNVLNIPVKDIKIDKIIEMLSAQPKEQEALSGVHTRLKSTLNELMQINNNNKVLLQETMDMMDFELNLVRSTVTAPQTANYDRGAYEAESVSEFGSFDAKQ